MNGLPVKNAQLFAQSVNPLIGTGPERARLEARFWPKARCGNKDECWVWQAQISQQGYGRFTFETKRPVEAHQVSYWLSRGSMPKGLEIDHLCCNRACVNPNHLEAVTHRTNMLRGKGVGSANARKTECIRGHKFDEENTYHWQGKRQCKTCNALRTRLCKRRKLKEAE